MERERSPGNGSLRSDMPATVRTVVSASTVSSHAQKGRKGEMGQQRTIEGGLILAVKVLSLLRVRVI